MRTKKAFINFITDVIPLIIVSVLGIFKLKLFLQVLGNETLGLYQLFTQIMIYVALIDGGLESAVLYALFKPNADGDKKKLNALIAGAYKSFSLIGMLAFGIAFAVSFFVPLLIKDNTFAYNYIIFTFLLFSLSNVINYFFVPYRSLLEVKEKKYINNIVLQSGQIIQSVLEIIMLLLGFNLLIILFMHSVIKLLSNLVIVIYCKRKHPDIKFNQKEKNFSFAKDVKHLLFHKINGLISSNIDILLISKFMGLSNVAIYSAYNYIINMLKQILGKISGSLLAIVGNTLAKDNNNANYNLFQELNSMLFFIATILCVPLNLAIDSFIKIWYEGQIVTSSLIAISFTAVLFLYIIKMSINLFVNSKGLFKETRFCAATDSIINFALSIVLIHYIGIAGTIIGTAFGVFIAEYILKTIVIHRKVFNKSSFNYFFNNLKFFVIYILNLILGYYIIKQFTITNIFSWFLIFIIFTILNIVIILFVYYLLKETEFLKRFKMLFIKKEKI